MGKYNYSLFSYIFVVICITVCLFVVQNFFWDERVFAAETGIVEAGTSVNVNGQRLYFDVPVISKNQRTLVPLRGVFEKLGAQVEWVGSEKKIIIKSSNSVIVLRQYDRQAVIDGVTKVMDVAPVAYKDRTMIPLRFIAENLGMLVQWIPSSKIAAITDPEYFDNQQGSTILGFMASNYPGDNYSHSSLTQFYKNIDSVATFSYLIDIDGNIQLTGQPQEDSVRFANMNNIKPLAMVHNCNTSGFDPALAHAVLSVKNNRDNLINQIFRVMCSQQYAGVNVDIEAIAWNDRQYYSQFIKELKAKLAPYGFLTTVSIPAKTYDAYKGNDWSGAFDYAEIGKYADQVLLMTYDEHYINGAAGPVASVPWLENVLKFAVGEIPARKILLGIPGYGYDWSASGTKSIIFRKTENMLQSLKLEPIWDDNARAPHFSYTKDGIAHEVWYENSRSLSCKTALVEKYKLGGLGIWRLGFDNSSFWSGIFSGLTKSEG